MLHSLVAMRVDGRGPDVTRWTTHWSLQAMIQETRLTSIVAWGYKKNTSGGGTKRVRLDLVELSVVPVSGEDARECDDLSLLVNRVDDPAGETSRSKVCELLGSDSRQLFRLVLAVTLLINCSIR